MALRIAALEKQMTWFRQAQVRNVEMLHQSMSMVDMHQQILQRVSREVVHALVNETTQHISLHPDGRLNMQAYYEAYRKVIETAGQKYAEIAVVIWSQGHSIEESIERAKLEVDNRNTPEASESDSDYEVESFGGNLDQSSNEQVASTAETGG